MLRFSPLDYAIFGAFAVAILLLGFSAKFRQGSFMQFLVMGRQMSLPAFVATLVSSWYGGILGIGESVSYFGVGTLVMLGVPYYVFAVVFALFLADKVRGAEQWTIPERFERTYGKGAALVSAVLILALAIPAAHVLMLGILIQSVSGWHLTLSVVSGAAMGTAFLYKGGLLADVRMAILAFAMMYIGFGSIAAYCLANFPVAQTWKELGGDLLSWDGGQGVPMVVSFFILGAWTLVDPGFHQRVSAARTDVGRRGILISAACWFFFDLLSITTALYAVSLVPAPNNPLSYFPSIAEAVLPPGLKGIFFCGMVGTIVSAMVGYSLVSGATFGREIFCRMRTKASDSQALAATRWGIAVSTLAAIGLALSVNSVVQLWYSWAGAVVGALLLPVLLAYRSATPGRIARWVAPSMAAAFCVSIGLYIWAANNGNPYLNVSLAGNDFSLGTVLPGLVVSAIAIGLGMILTKGGPTADTEIEQ